MFPVSLLCFKLTNGEDVPVADTGGGGGGGGGGVGGVLTSPPPLDLMMNKIKD